MKKTILLLLLPVLLAVWITPASAAKQHISLKTALVRNNDLWVKTDIKETQVTHGEYVRNPQWSYDGNWIAYTKGAEQTEIWLYHAVTGSLHLAGPGHNAQWAPARNELAFQTGETLNLIRASDPDKLEANRVAERVGNYSWLPDGSGFLFSTLSMLSGGRWSDIELYTVKWEKNANKPTTRLFYRIPSQSEQFFAVTTSPFKWSPDGKWIAFLAKPTASLSADGNTLCFLAADARSFVKAGQMLDQFDWFQWAPAGGLFAYIEGTGREAIRNKRLTVVEGLPSLRETSYTPAGFADRGFAWQNDRTVVVARAKEAEWSVEERKRPMPKLLRLDLASGQEKQITSPPAGQGDFYPLFVQDGSKLTWVRTNRKTADAIVADPDGKDAKRWIRQLTPATNYYERWNWSEVIDYADSVR